MNQSRFFAFLAGPALLAAFATDASAATVTVDASGYLTNVGGTAAGSQGNITLDPTGVLGWADWNSTSLTPNFSGGSTTLSLAQIGTFTLETIADSRFRDVSTSSTNTVGIRGRSATGLGDGEGFRLSFVPGTVGSFSLTIHTGDFNTTTNWAVSQGGNAVGSGTLATVASALDEGPVIFNFTVANSTEAAATWDFDLTRGATGGNALFIGGASLVPEPSAALLGGLGMLALLRRRRSA